MRLFAAVVLTALAVPLLAAAQETPFNAGFVRLTVDDEPEFPVAVWYPASTRETLETAGPRKLSAAFGAPPAEAGPFPLILLSHGSRGSEMGHHDWAAALTRHGFVVAAPRHVGDSFDHPNGRGSDVQLVGRPWQITKTLDRLLADPRFASVIDTARIGIIGYSAGGYTALVEIGGRPNFDRWEAHCDVHPDDRTFCPSWWAGLFISLPRITRPGWTLPQETRIRAAVLMAPATFLFSPEGLSGVTVPVRLYRAADDTVVPSTWHADRLAEALPQPPETVTVPGGHYVFLAPIDGPPPSELAPLFADPPGLNRKALHRRIAEELVEFFSRTLKIGEPSG